MSERQLNLMTHLAHSLPVVKPPVYDMVVQNLRHLTFCHRGPGFHVGEHENGRSGAIANAIRGVGSARFLQQSLAFLTPRVECGYRKLGESGAQIDLEALSCGNGQMHGSGSTVFGNRDRKGPGVND